MLRFSASENCWKYKTSHLHSQAYTKIISVSCCNLAGQILQFLED